MTTSAPCRPKRTTDARKAAKLRREQHQRYYETVVLEGHNEAYDRVFILPPKEGKEEITNEGLKTAYDKEERPEGYPVLEHQPAEAEEAWRTHIDSTKERVRESARRYFRTDD